MGGRQFASPGTNKTHPMSDKVRGALFNVLGDIEGLTVLDAFAGSGALGFEAISRGAAQAVVIDSDKTAGQTIAANIQGLGLADKAKLIKSSANAWLTTSPGEQFDLVFCDPPYNNLQPALVQRLAERVKPGGLLVLSWPGNQELPMLGQLEQISGRSYGDIQLAFYRHLP